MMGISDLAACFDGTFYRRLVRMFPVSKKCTETVLSLPVVVVCACRPDAKVELFFSDHSTFIFAGIGHTGRISFVENISVPPFSGLPPVSFGFYFRVNNGCLCIFLDHFGLLLFASRYRRILPITSAT